jgi:AAA-like domain
MPRRFHSYGPVDPSQHYCVERRELVEQCVAQLVGDPDKGGHYFTIWAPRQTGKTWLMRRAVDAIRERYGDRFAVGKLSAQGMVIKDGEPPETLFQYLPDGIQDAFGLRIEEPRTWADAVRVFRRSSGTFDRPIILLIDEFDSLPPAVIDLLVSLFRNIYLAREDYWLHGLALIGVRAVLGLDSPRGSPFNIQRSLHVPNLTAAEVEDMFDQYRRESGQVVEPDVPGLVFAATRGQPGLVGWFGELLAEKYNPGEGQPITAATWRKVHARALSVEWNNTLLNLIKKARGPYREQVIQLFTDPSVPFSLRKDWCNYLYMNGIIDAAAAPEGSQTPEDAVCRFSSPFVQLSLYAAFTDDLFGDKGPILAIEPGDYLADVFTPGALCIPPLMDRYRGYLRRLKARGVNPWKDQPRRADLHLTEAVGHFHLYAWLRDAVGRRCAISPEFPTGNGKVDLVLRTREGLTALVEVKSFIDMYELGLGQAQAAAYAKKLGLAIATLAVFVPVEDEAILAKISGEAEIDGVKVITSAVGWV